jgi:hypothetical protein
MNVRSVALALTVALLVALVAVSASAVASSGPSVPVVRCPTTGFLPPGAKSRAPSRIGVLGSPSSVRGLAAYTNFEEFLVGPAGMRCSGAVGADGNGNITVWPAGRAARTQHARSDGLTLILDPACASCRAADACPFFPKLAASLGFPCSTTSIPKGEGVYHLNADATDFEDPPGVAGNGWPSGGPDPANGIDGVNVGQASSVYRSTCTLPKSEHGICTISLNDVLARYGQTG